MKISVIIPAYNEEKLLPETLRHVRTAMTAFTGAGWETELIVCDNNSTDRTAAIAASEGATVVFEPVNQIARARNRGAAAASGDWLLFLDADSPPSRELFEAAAARIREGRCLAGGATVKMTGAPPLARCVNGLWNLVSRTLKWCAGSFIFCEAEAFRKTGGFSLDLYASEEIDLSRRLKKLARREGRSLCIISKPPLATSARKLSLYTYRDHFRVLFNVLLRPRGTLGSREACSIWYDGRR